MRKQPAKNLDSDYSLETLRGWLTKYETGEWWHNPSNDGKTDTTAQRIDELRRAIFLRAAQSQE
jgi:hypothetical protein